MSSGGRRSAALAGALALATVAVYAQVARFDFIHYDDLSYLIENPNLRGAFDARELAWAFSTDWKANWHPLTWLSWMLDVRLFGKQAPGVFHLLNLFWHLVATLLCFAAFARLTRDPMASAWVAGVFALHPLHVESVAWIAERKDVLAGAFWMGGLLAWERWARAGSRAGYALALLCLALGLLAKPLLVTFPCVLLLLDAWPLARRGRTRLLVEKLPFFALAIASSVVTYQFQQRGGAVVDSARLGFPDRLANAAVSYVAYLRQALWPTDLAVLYPHPGYPGQAELPAWQPWLAAALLLAATLALLERSRRGRPAPLVGWLWFLGTLVPMIGLVQAGSGARADRYTYVPLVGLALTVAFGARDLARSGRLPARAAAGAGALALLVLAGLAHRQASLWRDSETLFRHTLAVTSRNSRIEHNLATYLQSQGRIEEAKRFYARALDSDPSDVDPAVNLGLLHIREGEIARGVAILERAVRVRPRHVLARHNLGHAYLVLGRREDAIEQFRRALDAEPEPHLAAQLHDALARQLRETGDFAAAASHRERAVSLRREIEARRATYRDGRTWREEAPSRPVPEPGG